MVDNLFLDHVDNSQAGFEYAVFGQVVSGMEVVDSIKQVPTTRVGIYQDVPKEDVIIESVDIVKRKV